MEKTLSEKMQEKTKELHQWYLEGIITYAQMTDWQNKLAHNALIQLQNEIRNKKERR